MFQVQARNQNSNIIMLSFTVTDIQSAIDIILFLESRLDSKLLISEII